MKSKFQSVINFIVRSKKTLLLIIIVAFVSVSTTTLISVMLSHYDNFSFPSLGTIKTIGVDSYYLDSDNKTVDYSNKTEKLNWGILDIGSTNSVELLIKSTSNYDVILNLSVTDWTPENISDYLTVSWDYKEEIMKPGEELNVILTLSSSSSPSFISYLIDNKVKTFNCDIHIVASEPKR